MSREELAARSLAAAAENERRVLAVLATAGAAGVRPGRDLADLTGLAGRTLSDLVARLEGRGLAKRDGKRRVWATDAGRGEAGAGVPGVSLGSALDAAIDCFPAEQVRAFVRLLLAAVIARWHLASEYDAGWPGFILPGPTATGKTSVAAFVCRAYGLVELEAIRASFRETPGSLIGRRVADAAGATGWRVERSPMLALPFVCIDEWGRASRELQAAAGGLLLGATADELEGERFELRPTVLVTLNSGPAGLPALDPAHVRRSVVLDTTPLVPLLDDLDREMWRLFQSGQVAIPRLRLDRLRPPLSALPTELRDLLRAELRAGLTDHGLRHADVESLARIALGRPALTHGPLEQAVIATAYDYLLCADTLGQARDGYASRLQHRLGAGSLLPDPDAAQRQRQELTERRLSREIEQYLERDQLVEDRAGLEQMLTHLIDRLDLRRLKDCSPQQQVAARRIAARLREVRAAVTAARTRQALEAAEGRAQDPSWRAGLLLEQIDQDRGRRRQIKAVAVPTQRSRRPEHAPARDMAGLILAMLPGATGQELETLAQQSQHLEQSAPTNESERRRAIEQLQAREIHSARMTNPWLT